MNKSRSDTRFSLRYAVRVLERQARMWGVISAAFKFCSLLSGTVALAALTATNKPAAIALGLVFAVLQGAEITLGPSGHRSQALATRREYARLLARQATLCDADLEAAYQTIVADDDIIVIDGLRDLAYNDVAREQGLAVNTTYRPRRLLNALS